PLPPTPLTFFLDGPAIKHGAAQNPAVINGKEKLLDEHLGVGIGKYRPGGKIIRALRSQDVRHEVARLAQRQRLLVPLAVLAPAAMVPATIRRRWKDGAIVAKPYDPRERPTLRILHALDPFAVLQRFVLRWQWRGPCAQRSHEQRQRGGQPTAD
ncbi:MAG: hypothetical protein R3212_12770, partial [Xanthomonadales bacterium]|nr:hypothetical protein [Xanthomonadales bacterium]